MGYQIKVKCSSCSYEKNFKLGNGLKDCQMENVCSHFKNSGKMLETLSSAESFLYETRLGSCKACHKLSPIATVIYSKHGLQQRYKEECTCGGSYRILLDYEKLDKGMPELTCPLCGKTCQVTELENWD